MEDFHYLQHDISAIEGWVSSNYLTLNSAKCKYMIVSKKANPSSPAGLSLGNSNLEKLECFKYLGLLQSSNLTFSQHIASICTKARRITGLLYRRFYHNANSDTLLQLYRSLVRLYLEYASPVWNPYLHKDTKLLENVERFALRMITRKWDACYQELLDTLGMPSLGTRRLQSTLCTLYKIVHGLCFIPPDIVTPRSDRICLRTNNLYCLQQPFARTNAFLNSFLPHAVRTWNTLLTSLISSSLTVFKSNVMIICD